MNIAFTGVSGTGKSTLSKYLQSTYNYRILSFGDEPKKLLGRAYIDALHHHEMNSIKFINDNKFVVRDAIQAFADTARTFYSEVWIWPLVSKLDDRLTVIDDVRYPNEAEILQQRGFVIVKLISPHIPLTPEQQKHNSEQQIKYITENYRIDNHYNPIVQLEKILAGLQFTYEVCSP